MPVLDNNAFDKQLDDKLQDHETEYSVAAWENMQAKLDTVEKPLFGSGFKRSVIIGSILMLLLSVSFLIGYEFSKHDNAITQRGFINSKSGNQGTIIVKNQSELPSQNEKLYASNKNEPVIPRTRNTSLAGIITNTNETAAGAQFTPVNPIAHQKQPVKVDNHGSVPQTGHNTNSDQITNNANSTSGMVKTNLDSTTSAKIVKATDKKVKKMTTFKLPKASDIIGSKQANNGTISFGLYVGENWNMAFDSHLFSASYSLDGTFGAFINFPVTNKLSIQSGLGYGMVPNKFLIKSDTSIINNDIQGKIYQVTQNTTYTIGYLRVPIILKYRLDHRFKVLAGVQISYALSAPVYTNTTNYKKDSFNNYHSTTPIDSLAPAGFQTSNISSNINRFGLEWQAGLEWNISKSFDLSLSYFSGITKVMKNQNGYAFAVGNSAYSNLQLRLGFKLFHKKFHED